MKMHINNQAYKQLDNNILLRKRANTQASDFTESKNNKNEITHRPAEALSFSGSVSSIGNRALNKFVDSKTINGLINKVYDNEAAFNAIYALIVAGILKPIAVMHMPGSEDKDKQIVATKNFIQAFLGSFLSFTIGGGFIKKAVDIVKNDLKTLEVDKNGNASTIKKDSAAALELAKNSLIKEKNGLGAKINNTKQALKEADNKSFATAYKAFFQKTNYTPTIDEIAQRAEELVNNFAKNHKEIFEKNPKFMKQLVDKTAKNIKSGTTYSDAFETFWKNSTGALTSIGKAKISSLLLPSVMAFLFAKKNLEKEQRERLEKEDFSTMLKRNTNFQNEQEKFQQLMHSKNSNLVSFNGNLLNKAIYGTAGIIEKAGMSRAGEACTKALAHAKKPSARMADIESIAITTYWLQNTARSKKIEDSQKLGLNVHTALVTMVSSTCAFLIDWAMDGLIGKAKNTYTNKIKDAVNDAKNTHKDILANFNTSSSSKNITPVVQMALDDACKKAANGSKEIDSETISNILSELKNSKVIAKAIEDGSVVDEELVKKTISHLKQTEPIKGTLEKNCKNLLDSSTIAKNLSQIDLKNADIVNKEIAKLSDSYGKKLNKFKSLTIFTIVVRFLVPVLMVPISGKLKKKIVELTSNKKD